MLRVEIKCPMCGGIHEVWCDENEFENWENGELIQRAMPNLNPTEREQLVSHICPTCQARVFGA